MTTAVTDLSLQKYVPVLQGTDSMLSACTAALGEAAKKKQGMPHLLAYCSEKRRIPSRDLLSGSAGASAAPEVTWPLITPLI